jgi:hypothetical protein
MNRAHEKSPRRVFQGLVCRFNKVVDFGSELLGAIVYDVVGYDIFPLGREYAIILAV